MFSDLIIAYSSWYILLAIIAGLLSAAILYFRNRSNKISTLWTVVLFTLRFLSVFMLAVLLLSPYFNTREKIIEKPVVVMAYDNSQSVIQGDDSAFYKTTFPRQWQNLPEAMQENYRIETYLFGSEVRKSGVPDNMDATSDYSELISHIKNEYNGMNLGAIVLAGDGIYNKGTEPVFAASGLSVPFYTIALGDTMPKKDIKITDVRYNSLVYKDDIFPLEISITADILKGKKAELAVSAFGETQQQKRISIKDDDFSATYSFKLLAKKTGKHHIKIDILLNEEELNKQNNHESIFVDVFDNEQKILILANSPHPDISAISQSLASYQQYETEVAYSKDLNMIKIKDYDLVILHQLPSVFQRTDELFSELSEFEIPMLFIIGKQSSLPAFNQQFKGMNILTSIGKYEEARPDINPLFTPFLYDINFITQLEKLPPLISPLGNYTVSPSAEVFAHQRINSISTDFPLVVFYDETGMKSGAIAGEGIWMWRIHNYMNDGNFEAFDSFLNKTIQYLSVKKDKRFFRINTKNEYTHSEDVILNAELYNASYEAVNDAEVSLRLTDEEGQQFNYLFSPEGRIYTLDLKQLDVGVHQYVAQTQLGNEQYESRGAFIVSGASFESRRLQANHGILYRMAELGGGKMLYPDQLSELPLLLAENDTLKKRTYFEEKLSGLNTIPLVLILILFLLSLEWFLRKYFGSY